MWSVGRSKQRPFSIAGVTAEKFLMIHTPDFTQAVSQRLGRVSYLSSPCVIKSPFL